MKVLETAVGAIFAPTRFSLVRISIRDLVADGKSLVRNARVGGGGHNLVLRNSSDQSTLAFLLGRGPKGVSHKRFHAAPSKKQACFLEGPLPPRNKGKKRPS